MKLLYNYLFKCDSCFQQHSDENIAKNCCIQGEVTPLFECAVCKKQYYTEKGAVGCIEKCDSSPIFEVTTDNNHWRIFENGVIEGFPEDAQVINRIPVVLNTRIAKWCEKAEKNWAGAIR